MSDQETFDALKGMKKKRKFLDLPPFVIFAVDLIKLVIIAFIIVWPIHRFVFQPFYVVGPSMEPSFYDKEYLIIEKVNYRLNSPKRGDVIIFQSQSSPGDYLIKRIIALPNEKIRIKGGKVYIYNDFVKQETVLDESEYLSPGTVTPGDIDIELLDDEYYVLGDNRNMSLDSRVFGAVKQKYITGRAWFRGWPFDSFGLIKTMVFAY